MATSTTHNTAYDACCILHDALSFMSWASVRDYTWTKGGIDTCSYTLYDNEDVVKVDVTDPAYGNEDLGFFSWGDTEFYKWVTSYPIDHTVVQAFIHKVGTEGLDQSNVPEYGQLGKNELKTLLWIHHGYPDPFDDYDSVVASNIVQFILFGEVVYG